MPDVIYMHAVDDSGAVGPRDAEELPEPAVLRDSRPEAEPVGGLTPYLDPLRIPPTLRPGRGAGLREDIEVQLRATWVRLHSQMAPTHVWAYDGHFPGPTFDVRRGQRIRVSWRNRIDSAYPAVSGDAPRFVADVPSSARAGRGPGFAEEKEVADLPAWSVTHLHGAATGGGNDGWPENGVPVGDAQLSEYPNDQRAAALWYHDHALHLSRWNVYAGLAGMYLVRDAEEDALHLPRGKYEVPLMLMDRNFEVDGQGRPTGELLYKVPRLPEARAGTGAGAAGETEKAVTLPFTGPYTLVNGVLWPYFDVEPRWYRFRLLNASNARIFDLVLIDEEGAPVRGAIKQIGSDGGLMPQPVAVDFDDTLPRLTIAPAERMDLLIDFRALRGQRVRLANVGRNVLPGEEDPAGDVPFPQVMEFRVGRASVHDGFVLPGVISSSFRRLPHDTAHVHAHRLIVLTPPGTAGGGGHPEIWEMAAVAEGAAEAPSDGLIQLTDAEGRSTTYRRLARRFDDALTFKVAHGAYERWSFLHLGGPVHPMHIHLSAFQVLRREPYVVTGFDLALGGTRAGEPVTFNSAPGAAIPLEANELGWKDVFRVRPGELVSVMGAFSGAHGRFMYHCHLLEHEGTGMMRPFVVVPPGVMTFGRQRPGHGGH
ncbi:multicopper oxidase family protein [Streptomyces johnsoniae]|uniref:Multicopper oxidase domain-containing protein n=1 Tax=Streptomyces johnsoniae TaxID=3075532 RepID=A0ABU2RZA2_9ACTN|nr:multicopper oxidase domain-containing protein [Streptomyces sp. DSM 41886]MDT0441828.1 multicopper oxidase domain-containing protein [Streptomyces sp. DSM 41886]